MANTIRNTMTLILLLLAPLRILPGDDRAIQTAPVGTPAGASTGETPRVLIFNSYHQGYRWTDTIVGTIFQELSDYEVDFTVEYMDSRRNPSERLNPSLFGLLHQKYRSMQPDLIIATDDAAYRFLLFFHERLFPNVPVVFCGINDFDDEELADRSLFTGVVERIHFRETIDLMLSVHPDTRTLFYLVDNSATSRSTVADIRSTLRFFPEVDLVLLQGADITTRDLYRIVADIPSDSLLLTTAWMQDRDNRYTPPEAVFHRLQEVSPAPIYGLIDLGLGHGVVGGMIETSRDQGLAAARIAARILDGESPADIPPVLDLEGTYVFDYRQLQRFAISRHALPDSAVLINEPFSFYRTYAHIIWTVVAVMLLQTATILFLVINIGRRRKAERLLQESREDLAITLNSIGDGVISTDLEGRIVRMNPAAEEMTGWRIDEVRSRHHRDALPVYSGNRLEDEISLVDHVLGENRTVTSAMPLLLRRRDGGKIHVAENAAPIRDAGGQVRGSVIVLRDMTEKRRLEEQLRQSQKMEAIGQLAGGIAHDFNNLLTGILAYASLIRDGGVLTGDEADYVNGILETAQRAGGITRQLLEFSRQGIFSPRPVQIDTIIRETSELLRHTFDRRIRIVTDLQVPRPLVFGDATQISQVLLNICINARDAMPEGGDLIIVTDTVELESADERSPLPSPGRYLRIRISDTGTGIPKVILHRIFDPFFTTKEAGKGTGMGLASAYGIIQNHNGSISAENRPEGGASFSILLPFLEERAEEPERPPDRRDTQRRRTENSLILLVEDEGTVRDSLSQLLISMGYRVHAVSDGREATEWFEGNHDRTHLVILDMNMPVLDGFEAFRRMKRIHPAMRCLIVTGFAVSRKTTEMLRDGALSVLTKPFTKEELADALRQAPPSHTPGAGV